MLQTHYLTKIAEDPPLCVKCIAATMNIIKQLISIIQWSQVQVDESFGQSVNVTIFHEV